MQAKKHSKNNFFKKNIYYLVFAFVLLAVVAVSVVLFVNDQDSLDALNSSGQSDTLQRPQDSTGGVNSSTNTEDSTQTGGNENEEDKPEDKPTQTVVSFILPVENSTVICDYTATSVVYNKTLNVYTGHLAIDFGADYGANVKAVYAGEIESITTSYLTGTTVTIDHGNNLKTVYNGLEVAEGLTQGMKVSQGAIIGYVSDNNRQEYKDGPHLHFEVWKDGSKISPYKYLSVSDK
ncbi:MAG: M23 family metallopeptidase [Clostridiales bacterium]|nr:M23 family metallopeptidase [Clostridiales bacterium]